MNERTFQIDVSKVPADQMEGFLMGVRAVMQAKIEEKRPKEPVFQIVGFETGGSAVRFIGQKQIRPIEHFPDYRRFLVCSDDDGNLIRVRVPLAIYETATEQAAVDRIEP